MNQYKAILGPSRAPRENCIAFLKYDGSNMRFEWDKKQGWHKFGTKNTIIGHGDEKWGRAIEIFDETYAEDLAKIFKDDKQFRGVKSVLVFCEYFGTRSFAGWHADEDDFELVLFDVNVHKKGIMAPRDFINTFESVRIPEVLYEGKFGPQLISAVRDGDYGQIEGTVAKGILPGKKAPHGLWMSKIKTKWWLQELGRRCVQNDMLSSVLVDNAKEQEV